MQSEDRLRPMELEFLRRLDEIREFDFVGFRAEPMPRGGIAISRYGQLRGVWTEDDWVMFWQPSSAEAPVRHAATIDEALRQTMKIVLMSLKVRRLRSAGRAA